MNQKELKELIEFLIEKDIAEFELERGDVKVKIKRGAELARLPDSRYFAVHPAVDSSAQLLPPSQPRWNSAQLPRLLLNPKSICTS